MAQAQQIFGGVTPTPGGEYVVVDNAPASNYAYTGGTKGTITAGASGYDNSVGCSLSGTAGTLSQATNPFKNGTIPDFLVSGTTSTAGVTFKNPVGKGN